MPDTVVFSEAIRNDRAMHPENSTTTNQWNLTFDGGSNGNPGPSAGAAVLVSPTGQTFTASIFIPHATNNQAEYAGLICGLELAKRSGARNLSVRGDSKLVVNQVSGEWKTKEESLKPVLAEAKELSESFRPFRISWIPREENSAADAEVRRCLESHFPSATTTSSTENSSTADESIPARYFAGKYAALNRKPPGHVSFQELIAIKVGGQDEFSRKKSDALIELLGDDANGALAAIGAALDLGKPNLPGPSIEKQRVTLELTALRWTLRGLRPEHAAQKVLADLELSIRAMQGRGSR